MEKLDRVRVLCTSVDPYRAQQGFSPCNAQSRSCYATSVTKILADCEHAHVNYSHRHCTTNCHMNSLGVKIQHWKHVASTVGEFDRQCTLYKENVQTSQSTDYVLAVCNSGSQIMNPRDLCSLEMDETLSFNQLQPLDLRGCVLLRNKNGKV